MQIVIDIDENVFTRLFDNGIEDYEIVNDDLFAIAKSIRKGKSLDAVLDEIRAEIEEMKMDVDLDIGNEMIYNNAIKDVLEIIDKHREERGEKE